jgi:hypothetical protein
MPQGKKYVSCVLCPASCDSCNLVKHAGKNPPMHRVKHVPIEKPRQSGGIKNSGLPKDGALAICFHLELSDRDDAG